MSNLETTYMGLKLKNPIIAGASKKTSYVDSIKELEKAGAGAIVTGSLFEEQIQLDKLKMESELAQYDNLHPEMLNVFPELDHGGPKEHLFWLKKTNEEVSIPVIASLNCVNKATWTDYAKQIEETGVDGLELNFFHVPLTMDKDGSEVENEQLEIIKDVLAAVNIPVSVKLSYFYSNPLNFIKKVSETGVKAVVLFNRLFQPEIDPNEEQHATPFNLSNENDHGIALRYAGLLHNQIDADICSNTGIFTGSDVVKMILAGAGTVQVVSTLYKNGTDYISTMVNQLQDWMYQKNYSSLDDFRGKLSRENTEDNFVYKRGQYVSLLMRSEELLKLL